MQYFCSIIIGQSISCAVLCSYIPALYLKVPFWKIVSLCEATELKQITEKGRQNKKMLCVNLFSTYYKKILHTFHSYFRIFQKIAKLSTDISSRYFISSIITFSYPLKLRNPSSGYLESTLK